MRGCSIAWMLRVVLILCAHVCVGEDMFPIAGVDTCVRISKAVVIFRKLMLLLQRKYFAK